MTTAYPLAWPIGFPRTKSRVSSRFKTTVHQSVNNVTEELRRFGNDTGKPVTNLIVSSNVTMTITKPNDPGIACYFIWDNVQVCIAVDRYLTPMENLQAVALIIEAERTKMRHGGLNIVRAAFRGYASLPPPIDANGALLPPWWQVLGLSEGASVEQARTAYLQKVKVHHPDKGGDAAQFNRIVDAWRAAQESEARR